MISPSDIADLTVPTSVDDSAVTLQAAALLLDYPGPGAAADLDLIGEALVESPSAPGRASLAGFVRWWGDLAQTEREQRYVATFDLGEAVSLYLTERLGMGRGQCVPETRGARLLALRRAYEACGVAVRRDELPDYLPLVLESAARAPAARALLLEHRAAIERIGAELEERHDPFAAVVAAVLAVVADPACARTTATWPVDPADSAAAPPAAAVAGPSGAFGASQEAAP